jgi:hypothetical protein
MGIKEGEDVQVKGVGNIFNKMIAENFSNLDRYLFKYRKSHETKQT